MAETKPKAPVAWIRFCSDGSYEGPIHDSQMDELRRRSGAWTPLDTSIVPGVMHCAKCDFRLVRKNLYVLDGTVGAGGSEPEPCPNGCGTQLAPVTWEQDAREAWKRLEDMVEQAQAASPDAIGPKLPSRFQIGETIRARGEKGIVQAVSFLVIDGQGKVAYDVLTRHGLQARVLSDDIGPAQPSHLRSVDNDG